MESGEEEERWPTTTFDDCGLVVSLSSIPCLRRYMVTQVPSTPGVRGVVVWVGEVNKALR